jgi:hypothetical protein
MRSLILLFLPFFIFQKTIAQTYCDSIPELKSLKALTLDSMKSFTQSSGFAGNTLKLFSNSSYTLTHFTDYQGGWSYDTGQWEISKTGQLLLLDKSSLIDTLDIVQYQNCILLIKPWQKDQFLEYFSNLKNWVKKDISYCSPLRKQYFISD